MNPDLYCAGLLNKKDSPPVTLMKIMCYIPLSPIIITYILLKNICIFFCNTLDKLFDCIEAVCNFISKNCNLICFYVRKIFHAIFSFIASIFEFIFQTIYDIFSCLNKHIFTPIFQFIKTYIYTPLKESFIWMFDILKYVCTHFCDALT